MKAAQVMLEAGIDISHHSSDSVDKYLNDKWDSVITVCGGAKETCPVFVGEVKNRLHMGFDDPSDAVGTPEDIYADFVRVREQIRGAFYDFYKNTYVL